MAKKKLTQNEFEDRAIKIAVVAMLVTLVAVFFSILLNSFIPMGIGFVLFYIWVIFFLP